MSDTHPAFTPPAPIITVTLPAQLKRTKQHEHSSIAALLYLYEASHISSDYAASFAGQLADMNSMAVITCRLSAPSVTDYLSERPAEQPVSMDPAVCTQVLQSMEELLPTIPSVDPHRVCLLGAAGYGSHIAVFAMGHTDRFRAAIIQSTIVNPSTSYGADELGSYTDNTLEAASFKAYLYARANMALLRDVDHYHTPCLIIHGLQPHEYGREQSEQLYSAIKDRCPDTPCRMAIFPPLSSILTETDRHNWQQRYVQELLSWCQTYTKPQKEGTL